MGSFLDKPITEKHTEYGSNDDFVWAVASMQGWRASMEDSHCTLTFQSGGSNHYIFGVFDGHGGKLTAKVSAESLHKEIIKNFSIDKTEHTMVEAKKCGAAMIKSFVTFDRQTLRSLPAVQAHSDCSGTTANVVYILPDFLVVANAGDSRSIVGTLQKEAKEKTPAADSIAAIAMSVDHKPKDKTERDRIVAAGGHVSMNRVDGDLAVSRALGDFIYKDPELPSEKQKVSPVPEIRIHKRSAGDRFMVLACDGVWDVMSNVDVAEFVASGLKMRFDVEKIATELLDFCLRKGSRDNMTAIVILFKSEDEASASEKPSGESA